MAGRRAYIPDRALDLAQKIQLLYHDRSLLNAMGLRARDWANHNFSVDKYATELMEILSAAVGERAGAESFSIARPVS